MAPAIRQITTEDTHALASVHACSWRSAYRGMLQDDFLDGDLVQNRLSLWARRLNPMPKGHFGYIAHAANEPIGFAFAFGAHDADWGTQIDNLHVVPPWRGRGIGKRLLRELVMRAHTAYPNAGMYLWVYEHNANARRFYEALGGEPVERKVIEPPGGGQVAEWRYVWRNATSLLTEVQGDA